jgi:hypothetical protein
MTRHALLLGLALALVGCASVPPSPPAAVPPDWSSLASEETIQVVTRDEDGGVRETTVWLVVVDGVGTIRTGNTHWYQNLMRDPALKVRMGGLEYAMRIEPVTDAETRRRINAVYRAKYKVQDQTVQLFRGVDLNMLRLRPQ